MITYVTHCRKCGNDCKLIVPEYGENIKIADHRELLDSGLSNETIEEIIKRNTWQTDPPTKAGWYWAMHKEFGFDVYHTIADSSGNLMATGMYADYFLDLSGFSHWLGPIPKPQKPEEVK